MLGTISPNVARAAVGLHRSHSHAPSLDVLDAVMRDRAGSLVDFGSSIDPCTPFGDILAEAFDRGMSPTDWRLIDAPATSAILGSRCARCGMTRCWCRSLRGTG